MSITFDKYLETGNQEIDEQHKELIDRVNKVRILADGPHRTYEYGAFTQRVFSLDFICHLLGDRLEDSLVIR